MKHITTITYRMLNDAIKTISYAVDKNREELSAIHFCVYEERAYMCATDGIAFVAQQIPMHESSQPFGVDAFTMKQACSALNDLRDALIELIRHDDMLHIHPEGRDDLAFIAPVSTWWDKYQFLFSHQHAAVIADVTCADVVAALKTSRANDLCITYRRGSEGASSWTTISARSEDCAWSDLIDLPSSSTVALDDDRDIVKLFVQRSYLLNALKRAGKTARFEMINGWPARAGGVRIVGNNDSMHIIVAMNDTTREYRSH